MGSAAAGPVPAPDLEPTLKPRGWVFALVLTHRPSVVQETDAGPSGEERGGEVQVRGGLGWVVLRGAITPLGPPATPSASPRAPAPRKRTRPVQEDKVTVLGTP